MYPYKYKDNKKKRLIKDSLGEAGVKKLTLNLNKKISETENRGKKYRLRV